ncbi:hypothetical protein THI4931_17620 [Pandoraea sputorum]|nr:hypothetical protein THI4931_17620 [Pandoraea sputorum]
MSGSIGVKAKRPIPIAIDKASMHDNAMRHAARSGDGWRSFVTLSESARVAGMAMAGPQAKEVDVNRGKYFTCKPFPKVTVPLPPAGR